MKTPSLFHLRQEKKAKFSFPAKPIVMAITHPFLIHLPFTPLVLTFFPVPSGTLICDCEEPSPPDLPPSFLSLLDRIHRRFLRRPHPHLYPTHPIASPSPVSFSILRFPRFHSAAFFPLLLCSPFALPVIWILQLQWLVALF